MPQIPINLQEQSSLQLCLATDMYSPDLPQQQCQQPHIVCPVECLPALQPSLFSVSMLSPSRSRKYSRSQSDNKSVNHGHWSASQHKLYHWFLEIHYRHFVNRQMRRMDKIFKTMQVFVKTRHAQQCRSHHQKMENKFKTFPAIIAHLRQLHYSEITEHSLTADMLQAQVRIHDNIPTIQQLQLQTVQHELTPKRTPTSKAFVLEEETVKEQLVEEEKYQQQEYKEQEKQINQLGKHFFDQSQLQFGQISLHHDKEESFLFNFFN